MKYADHFGTQTQNYLHFRPTYPRELFQYLASLVNEKNVAWDCGAGNGQAALTLANKFKRVIATDINQTQLDVAIKKENIEYRCCAAEETTIQDQSVDLITVAQALHWFDFEKFYREVKRVLKPQGIIAIWCYSLGKITPEIDVIIYRFYQTILNDYWPKERRYIDDEYKTIPFPFHEIISPQFIIEKQMTFSQLMGYLSTWSALKEYQKRNHKNPLEFVHAELQMAWGDTIRERIMHWPLHLRVGKND
jgi:ubiquinone/menaquinone biosynthesis C-methylase UbiE